jgi:anti-sigma regulatory factor (Ser/Thr protein kinase)
MEPEPERGRPGAYALDGAGPDTDVRHEALIYRARTDWLESVRSFVGEGLARDEPVSIGVSVHAATLLREALRDLWARIDFFDMTALGRNPGRILPAMLEFAARYPGRPVRYVSEPLWPGRSTPEIAEVSRHEALLESAFADIAARVLCIYDGDGLNSATISCAEQTHPAIIGDRWAQVSVGYAGPGIVPPQCDHSPPPPPADAAALSYNRDLRPVRAQVASCARAAGLAPDRTADLVLAVSEVAANSLRHASGTGTLHTWITPAEIICEIRDSGIITDPLAGRRRPPSEAPGQGLWVVNQVCDLVELRSGPEGTRIRMHMYRPEAD